MGKIAPPPRKGFLIKTNIFFNKTTFVPICLWKAIFGLGWGGIVVKTIFVLTHYYSTNFLIIYDHFCRLKYCKILQSCNTSCDSCE